MLYGELALLITSMRNRATQLSIPEGMRERVFEDDFPLEELSDFPLEFPKEEMFPVVIFSFLGPEHGRIFYACMSGEQLVIRQSKLFKEEKSALFDRALFDLFARVLLSRPLQEKGLFD